MTNKLSKEAFIKLAEAYSKQEKYEKELSNNLETINEKYKVYMGFIGLSNSSDLIMDVVLDLLGEDFSYYFYDYDFKEGWTYHFELIHPDNQIVLNYGDERKLVLLAIIDNITGKDVDIYSDEFKFDKPKLYSYETLLDVNILNKDGLHEGVVVNYGSYRLKYKTDEYIRLHRIVTEFTPKRVWEALSNGQRIDRMNIPEEFIKWLDETERKLLLEYNELFDKINQVLADTVNMTNKEIALSDDEAIKEMREYIFAVRSGKDVKAKVWKAIKPKGEK